MWRHVAARFHAVDPKWVLTTTIQGFIHKEVNELDTYQIEQLIELLKKGYEAAYIARYRDDIHRGLSPQRVRKVIEIYRDALELNRKVFSALKTVIPKAVGVGEKKEVEERLRDCQTIDELSEIAREYGAGTEKSKAQVAREMGLEAPARVILNGECLDLRKFNEQYLFFLVADLINKDEGVKQTAIKISQLKTNCEVELEVNLTKCAKRKMELKESGLLDPDQYMKGLVHFSGYDNCRYSAYKIRDYQVSNLNRGEEFRIIVWKAIVQKQEEIKELHPLTKLKVHKKHEIFVKKCLNKSIRDHFIPMVQRGVKKYLCRRAECRSIEIFGKNVERLFCQQGVHDKYCIALDPGSIVKAAFLDPDGILLSNHQFRFSNYSSFDERATNKLKQWSMYTRDMGKRLVFAIGNGSNTRNTQLAVSKMIQNKDFPVNVDVCFCVVPEHGASIFSISDAAREEFGDLDPKIISAVSIGRRLIDPMSEYVKISPQNLGKGQYQHSNDRNLLHQKRVALIRDRVSLNGIDLNLASKVLLSNVSGLDEKTAAEIVKYREERGRFMSRNELKRVPGIDENVFQQCAGFLRVTRPDEGMRKLMPKDMQWNPLDVTVIHPDDYQLATQLLRDAGLTVETAKTMDRIPEWCSDKEKRIFELLKDEQVLRPPPEMMKRAREMRDLEEGRQYSGIVMNRTDFGIFVDIGVEHDGFIHLSHYDDNYHDPECTPEAFLEKMDKLEVPTVGDEIEVIVLKIEEHDNEYETIVQIDLAPALALAPKNNHRNSFRK